MFGTPRIAADPFTLTEATPLVASEEVPVTLTVELDVEVGTLESIETLGIVVSRLIVCVLLAVPPALVAEQVTAVVPSLLTVVVTSHAADLEVIVD